MPNDVPAPYWEELLPHAILRDDPPNPDTYFVRTGGQRGRLLEVIRPVLLELHHPNGVSFVWQAEEGDAIIRKGRRMNAAEALMVKCLTPDPRHRQFGRVIIAERVTGPMALFTALRQFGWHIEESILGSHQIVKGHVVRVPGQVDQLLDQVGKREALGKAKGIYGTAKELRRVLGKIRGGFQDADENLGSIYRKLRKGQISLKRAARDTVGAARFVLKIATFNPFTAWAKEPEVMALLRAEEIEDPERLMRCIARARSALKKGWKGIEVSAQDMTRVRRRITRAERRQA